MKKLIKALASKSIKNTQVIKGGQNGSGTRKSASSAQTQPKLL